MADWEKKTKKLESVIFPTSSNLSSEQTMKTGLLTGKWNDVCESAECGLRVCLSADDDRGHLAHHHCISCASGCAVAASICSRTRAQRCGYLTANRSKTSPPEGQGQVQAHLLLH